MLRLLRILLLTLLLTTCDKIPRNGWLDGQWQLVSMNGQDMKPKRIYWKVQLDLMELRSMTARIDTKIPYLGVVCRFSHQGQHLQLFSPFFILRQEGRDSLITPEMNIDFSPLGVKKIPTTFEVSSTSSTMTLTNEDQQLQFRRF